VTDNADRGAMRVRAQKASALLAGLRNGDARLFAHLTDVPQRMAAAEMRETLAPWEARLGAWQGTEILGNSSQGGHPETYARLTFEKGTKTAELLWSGMGLDSLRLLDAPPPVVFVPQKDGSFASYDVRTGSLVHLFFEDKGGAPALLVRTPDGEAAARREG
jgi:hypothetical protein